jgi:hypothetical protein
VPRASANNGAGRYSILMRVAGLFLLAASFAAAQPLQPVEVRTTQSADFTPGSTIRIGGTAGELNIATWEQPRVEATLSRTEYANAREQDRVKKNLERIAITVKKSGNDVDVEMTAPKRNFLARRLRGKTNADVIVRVMVPKNAKLAIDHGNGSVIIYDAGGDIDARAHFGDIVLQLAHADQFAIDARVTVGGIYTDYAGKYRRPLLIGNKFVSAAAAGARARRVTARVAMGGISIVSTVPTPEPGSPASSTPLH